MTLEPALPVLVDLAALAYQYVFELPFRESNTNNNNDMNENVHSSSSLILTATIMTLSSS